MWPDVRLVNYSPIVNLESMPRPARAVVSASFLCALILHTWRRAKRSLAAEPDSFRSNISDGVGISTSSTDDGDSAAPATTGGAIAEGTPVVPSWTTGELVRLSAPASGLCLTVVVEERRSRHRGAVAISLPGRCHTGLEPRTSRPHTGLLLTRVSLALDSPFARLRVTSEETVDFGGKGDGDDTLWVATDPTSSVTGLTHASKGKGGSSYALIATREGLAVRRRSSSELAGGKAGSEAGSETVANSCSLWFVSAVSRVTRGGLGDGYWRADGVGGGGGVGAGGDGGGGGGGGAAAGGDGDGVCGSSRTLPTQPARPARHFAAQRLQPSQLATFVRDGCLVLPGVVPASVLFRAQTAVNSRLGRPAGLSLFYDEARKVVPHF